MEMDMEKDIFKIRNTDLQFQSRGHELQKSSNERTQVMAKRYLFHINAIIQTILHWLKGKI